MRLPTLFLPHGGGPCFFMEWDPPHTWNRMGAWLRSIPALVGTRPSALLVISAHWEAPRFTLTSSASPGLIYDYSGFPKHTYRIEWPASGDPGLATRVRRLLSDAAIESEADDSRGLDHGVFVPLKLAFPDADIPVVQLSLNTSLDPAEHLRVGEAIAPLRDEGVLVIGSGMSYHNMERFRRRGGTADPASIEFDQWLDQALQLPPAPRFEALRQWTLAPGARESHPREEHLLPLHVVVGAAGQDRAVRAFRDEVMGSAQSAFRLGEACPERA